jgi:antitoxin MazE
LTKKHLKYILKDTKKEVEIMARATTPIQQWGNSLGIRIPKKFITSLKWQKGDELALSIENEKLLVQQAPNIRPKNIKELFKDFNSENYIPSEIDWGKNVGEELW